MYPILAHFLRKAVLPLAIGMIAAAVHTFLALALVIDVMQNVVRGTVTPHNLKIAIKQFLTLFADTFGFDNMNTKFHALLHLVKELQEHGTLPNCWVQERKHKTIKRYASDICNTRSYDRSVLGEVTCHHLHALRHTKIFALEIGLLKPWHQQRIPRLRSDSQWS